MALGSESPSFPTMDLILVRHGQPDWTPGEIARNDPNLTALGQEQAIRVAQRITGIDSIDQIWASTMVRALETAEPISAGLGQDLETHDWLQEINNPPDWEGISAHEVAQRFKDANSRHMDDMWHGLPGGETFRDFHQRVVSGLNATLAAHGIRPQGSGRHLWEVDEPDRRVVIVAHAGTNAVVLGHLLGLDPVPWDWDRFRQPHTGVSRLTLMPISTGWGFSLRQIGDVAHLDENMVTV